MTNEHSCSSIKAVNWIHPLMTFRDTSLQQKALLYFFTKKCFYCRYECALGRAVGVLCSVGFLFIKNQAILTIVYDKLIFKYNEKFMVFV